MIAETGPDPSCGGRRDAPGSTPHRPTPRDAPRPRSQSLRSPAFRDDGSWNHLLPEVVSGRAGPGGQVERQLPVDQIGAFRFFAGTALASRSDLRAGEWLEAGAAADGPELRASSYLADLLHRRGHLEAPESAFDDPRAFVHFTTLPAMQACRAQFLSFAVDSLPPESGALRVLDVGCGDGGPKSPLRHDL